MRSIIDEIEPAMNRKKKINAIFNKRMKKKTDKLTHNGKPKYISKAERAAQAELEKTELAQTDATLTEQTA